MEFKNGFEYINKDHLDKWIFIGIDPFDSRKGWFIKNSSHEPVKLLLETMKLA